MNHFLPASQINFMINIITNTNLVTCKISYRLVQVMQLPIFVQVVIVPHSWSITVSSSCLVQVYIIINFISLQKRPLKINSLD